MNKYLSYKDSEVGWIGEIPNTWKVSRVKKYFNERNEKVSDLDFPPLSVTKKGILPQLDNVSKSDNHNDRKRVCKNDFVINSRSDRKGSSGMSVLDGSVSLINIVLEPKSIIPKYSEYVFKSKDFIEEFFRNGKGIHWDLWSTRFSELQNIKIPIPSFSEQQQIVSFLDNKTSLIDSLIEKTQRKIELLKEKRTSLINEVVTKGLNPNVEMKDSGVEWIGEIPSHWDFIRLKYLFSLEGGKDPKNIQNDDGEYPILGTGGEISRGSDYLYDKPTLLLGRKGTIDKPYLYESPFWVSDVMYYTIMKKDISPRYLNFLFKTIPFEYYRYGSTQPSMSRLDYESMYFPIPPSDERQEISNYIDEQTQLIDKTVSIEEKRIELLKEYRQSLICEVVTGKRKVV